MGVDGRDERADPDGEAVYSEQCYLGPLVNREEGTAAEAASNGYA